jgi:hypothetical protein
VAKEVKEDGGREEAVVHALRAAVAEVLGDLGDALIRQVYR